MVPVPVLTFEKLRFRFQFQLHIQTTKSKFSKKKLEFFLPFYIVSCFTRKKFINFNKFIVKREGKYCEMKVSKYIILYLVPVSNSQKVTVPTVPVPQRCLVVHEPLRSPQEVLILLPHIARQPGVNQTQHIGQDHFLQGCGSAFISSGSGSSILD
jgi:hypothetical protein